MSTVSDYIKCDKCGGIMHTDFNCHTFEEYSLCFRCGKYMSYTFKYDRHGNVKKDKNNRPIYENKSLPGYGCIALTFKNGIGQIAALDKPLSKTLKRHFLREIEINPDVNKEESYLTYWDDKEKQVKVFYGKMPEKYDDML